MSSAIGCAPSFAHRATFAISFINLSRDPKFQDSLKRAAEDILNAQPTELPGQGYYRDEPSRESLIARAWSSMATRSATATSWSRKASSSKSPRGRPSGWVEHLLELRLLEAGDELHGRNIEAECVPGSDLGFVEHPSKCIPAVTDVVLGVAQPRWRVPRRPADDLRTVRRNDPPGEFERPPVRAVAEVLQPIEARGAGPRRTRPGRAAVASGRLLPWPTWRRPTTPRRCCAPARTPCRRRGRCGFPAVAEDDVADESGHARNLGDGNCGHTATLTASCGRVKAAWLQTSAHRCS